MQAIKFTGLFLLYTLGAPALVVLGGAVIGAQLAIGLAGLALLVPMVVIVAAWRFVEFLWDEAWW